MLDFATPHSTYEPVGENRGRFIVEPLARGFGYTFGNALRRVLLSSLEGAAISSVKITGVEHEFSTVPHVKEDVTDIILNLKKVVFVLHGEADDHEVMLVKDGPGAVTAADIQLPAAVEVMDPDAYIATLEDGGRLEMQLTVRRGRGYASADDNKPEQTILGVIPIDSIFSPVRRVAYRVEPARVGQRTDFDKLTLEVETNGALDPKSAVAKAAALLREDLLIFTGVGEEDEEGYAARRPRGRAAGGQGLRLRRHAHRGAGAGRPLLQLPQAGRHRDGRRSRQQVRAGTHVHPELRAQEHRRGARAPREEQLEAKGRIG